MTILIGALNAFACGMNLAMAMCGRGPWSLPLAVLSGILATAYIMASIEDNKGKKA